MCSTNATIGYRRGRAQARPSSDVPVLPPAARVDTSTEELDDVLRALRHAQGDELHAEALRLRMHMEAPLYAETHKHCVAMQAMRCTAAPWWGRSAVNKLSSDDVLTSHKTGTVQDCDSLESLRTSSEELRRRYRAHIGEGIAQAMANAAVLAQNGPNACLVDLDGVDGVEACPLSPTSSNDTNLSGCNTPVKGSWKRGKTFE